MILDKRNFFSDKFSRKTTEELRAICESSSHQEAAKLAAIWELERREDVSDELLILAENIHSVTEKRNIEKKAFEKYHTSGPRFFAALIDWSLFLGFALLINLIHMIPWINSLVNLLIITVPYAYSVVMHAAYGQTVGKILMGVKVVSFEGETRIGIGQAILRDIGPLVYIALLYLNMLFGAIYGIAGAQIVAIFLLILQIVYWFWGVLEIVTMLFDDKSRSLPDYIARTVVVRE